jgi:hypothetical protein
MSRHGKYLLNALDKMVDSGADAHGMGFVLFAGSGNLGNAAGETCCILMVRVLFVRDGLLG